MSDIRETLTNFTKNVTKTSGDLFKSTKLSMAVTAEQNALKNLHLEIGKKVHEIYQYGGNLGKYFDEKYREIEACEIKIEELKEQISLIKGVRECTKCGKSAERIAEFCPKCGIRFALAGEQPATQTQPKPDTTPSTPPADTIPPEPTPQPPVSLAPSTPAPPVTIDPPKTTRHCRVCGMENDINTKFCLSCGRIVD